MAGDGALARSDWASEAAEVDSVDRFEVDQKFTLWLAAKRVSLRSRKPLKPATVAKYSDSAQLYLNWLKDAQERFPDALTSTSGRDRAVAAYRTHVVESLSGPAANVALNAVRAYYDWLGLLGLEVKAAGYDRTAPRILGLVEQSRVLSAAETRPARSLSSQARRARDTALVMLKLYSGLKESEVYDLDIDDIETTHDSSCVWAPAPGGQMRQIALPARAHVALLQWEVFRRELLGDTVIKAYFLSWRGSLDDADRHHAQFRRLSRRSAAKRLHKLGTLAGVEQPVALSLLRATFTRQLLEVESDPKEVARTLGQVKPDVPQIRALRGIALMEHPGRPIRRARARAAAPEDQLALDF